MKTSQRNAIYWLLILATASFYSPAYAHPLASAHKSIKLRVSSASHFAIAITNFTLVDPQTNKDLYILRDGGIINKATVGSVPLNIRANEIDSPSGIRVEFDLQGPLNHKSVETQSPYALFGDKQGVYNGKVFPSGNYVLRASAYSVDSSGNAVLINEISLVLIVGQETNEIIGVNLIDAEFDTDLELPSREYHIQNGRIFDSDNYPFYLNAPREVSLKATTNSYTTGSVHFSLKGPLSHSSTENSEPFTLFGDQGTDFQGRILPQGEYTLTVTPYSGKNRQGQKGPAKIFIFSISDLPEISIQEFAGVVDATSDVEVAYLSPYTENVIDQKEVPTNFINLAVYPSFPEGGIGSVYLQLSGPVSHSRTEHLAPYALFGDTNFDYAGRSLPPGDYMLTATPFTGPNRSGLAGLGYSYSFVIRPSSAALTASEGGNQELLIWPNPAKGVSEVWIDNPLESQQAALYNFNGELIDQFSVPENASKALNIATYRKGYYFLLLKGRSTSLTKILVID